VAGPQFFRNIDGFDDDAAILPTLLDLYNFAHFFDNSGEHKMYFSLCSF